MCGITGLIKKSQKKISVEDIKIIEEMTKTLEHRGPDHHEIKAFTNCILGHRRLKIIDLSTRANQPMSNEDGSIWLTFNGEISNFLELKKKYLTESNKHLFRSNSDSEIIIHLYEEFGTKMFELLNGMFAIAILDTKKQQLFLARDRHGIKPLFYFVSKETFYFSSEITSFYAIPAFSPQPSIKGLNYYLSLGYFPGEITAYENIFKLTPGHFIAIQLKDLRFTKTKYYGTSLQNNHLSFKQALSATERLFANSIARNLISDVPVGISLSGGIDSSGIAAFAKKFCVQSSFHTFSLTFPDNPSYDESRYSSLVAKELGTNHHQIEVTPQKVLANYQNYLSYLDQPNSDGASLPLFLLCQEASRYVSVLLFGDGADEFFGGYDSYVAYKLKAIYNKFAFLFGGNFKKKIAKLLPVSYGRLSKDYVIKKILDSIDQDFPIFHHELRAYLNLEQKQKILQPGLTKDLALSQKLFGNTFAGSTKDNNLEKLMEIDQLYHLPDQIEVHSDRMAMAFSLEGRMPYLDNDLTNWAQMLPTKFKLHGFSKKYILKKMLAPYLPRQLMTKKKIGLNAPFSGWLRGELKEFGEELLRTGQKNLGDIFNFAELAERWHRHQAGQSNHGYFLWGLLNYFAWHEMYIVKKDFLKYKKPVRLPY